MIKGRHLAALVRLSKMSVFSRRRGRCPHRPTVKTAIIIRFQRIRNIHKRADVGIGPYEAFFDTLKGPPFGGPFSVSKNFDAEAVKAPSDEGAVAAGD